MTDAEFLAKMTAGIDRFQHYLGMALIMSDPSTPQGVLRNGTISFVDTGQQKLLITNAHVVEFFESTRATNPNAVFAVTCASGTPPIDISFAPVIDRSSSGVDLAILDFSLPSLIEQQGKKFFRSPAWPPSRAGVGDAIFLVGFPEIHRDVSARGLECRLTGICELATAVNDRQVMLVDEELARRTLKANPDLQDFGSLSGMSGCTAFCQSKDTKQWDIAGFMYEASQDGHKAMICINHADFIMLDGKLDRSRMPWL